MTRSGCVSAYARASVEPHDPPNTCQRSMPRCSRIFSMSATRSQVVLASERRVRRALAAAALVEVHDAVFFGMEEAALFGIRAAAGTAMQKHHRLAGRVAALLEVELVDGRNL